MDLLLLLDGLWWMSLVTVSIGFFIVVLAVIDGLVQELRRQDEDDEG